MKMNRKQERQAWTKFIDGETVSSPGMCSVCSSPIPIDRLTRRMRTCSIICGKQAQSKKYGGQRVEFNGREYSSLREANAARTLQMLELAGEIHNLRYQVRIVLVEGRRGVHSISYIADFTYRDADDKFHVIDAKGFKTDIYQLKKHLAALLLNIDIEEM